MSDIADCMPVLLRTILEGSYGDMSTIEYYERLAAYAAVRDSKLMDLLATTIVHVQNTYRSAVQHRHHVMAVPMEKHVDERVRGFLEQDCPVCRRVLRDDPRGVVRLKAANGNAMRCGHFMHRACLGQFEAHNLQTDKACPVCREDLGFIVHLWEDHESAVPRF
jgi:hypothetical protein